MNRSNEVQLMATQAQEALWAALLAGKLRDGQFLSMSQLAEILDFPIAPIREAVKVASAQGLLSALPKRGIRIMEAHPETIRECLDFRMVMDQEGARRRIASNALSGLDALRKRHVEMRDTARTDAVRSLPPQAIEIDLSLHDFLSDGLDNAQLAEGYAVNRMRIGIIQNSRPFLQDRIVSAMEEHIAIIDALENRDIETATVAIRHHCDQTLRWWGVT
jgi:DNA-binding GntR family transcriptional regulator